MKFLPQEIPELVRCILAVWRIKRRNRILMSSSYRCKLHTFQWVLLIYGNIILPRDFRWLILRSFVLDLVTFMKMHFFSFIFPTNVIKEHPIWHWSNLINSIKHVNRVIRSIMCNMKPKILGKAHGNQIFAWNWKRITQLHIFQVLYSIAPDLL